MSIPHLNDSCSTPSNSCISLHSSKNLNILESITLLPKEVSSENIYPINQRKITLINSPIDKKKLSPNFFYDSFKNKSLKHLNQKPFLDLKKHIQSISNNSIKNQKIFNFAKMLYDLAETEELIYQEIVGYMIYLSDQSLSDLLELIDSEDIDETINKIRHQFSRCLEAKIQEIENSISVSEKIEPEFVYRISQNLTTVGIGKFLITKKGFFNRALIPSLIAVLKENKEQPSLFKKLLIMKLNFLISSPEATQIINEIKLCPDKKSPIYQVIKIVLKASYHTKITNTHARQVALAAFLSHFRQPISGSCFSNSLVIELLSSQYLHCLKDFKELINKGMLTRKVDGKEMYFPFLITTNYHEITKTFLIDSEGKTKEGCYIWEIEGLKSICKRLNLLPKSTFIKILDLTNKTPHSQLVSLKELIRSLIKNSSTGIRHKINDFEVYTIYESEKTNLLLQVWNNSIAGMAEAGDNSMIKSAVIKSTMFALDVNFNATLIPSSAIYQRKQSFFQFMEKKLDERIQFLYDDNVSQVQDFYSGFVLYDKAGKHKPQKWIRIDNSITYQDFINRIIQDYLNNASYDLITHRMMEGLKDYVFSTTFIERLLNDYSYPKDWINEKIENGQLFSLKYLPWTTLSGNNATKVIQIYFEKETLPHKIDFVPKTGLDLLLKLVEVIKTHPFQQKKYHLYPIRVLGLHSFSLVPWQPSLKYIVEQENPENWIKKHILIPGKKLAESIINEECQMKILQLCKEKLVQDSVYFEQSLQLTKSISYQNFRTELLLALNKCTLKTQVNLEWVVDTWIYDNLPEFQKNYLVQSAISFADTNWIHRSSDIYFCFVVNPGTGELAMWESLDRGKTLKPLDQKPWLSNRTWEFFNNPEEYFVEDNTPAG